MIPSKQVLNFLIIAILSIVTFIWTFWVFHQDFLFEVIFIVVLARFATSLLIFNDYSLSWSKATQKTFLIKSVVNILAFMIYLPLLYNTIAVGILICELFVYLFSINFLVYSYYYLVNKRYAKKSKNIVIYGAGNAGLRLESEFRNSEYRIKYFVDDNMVLCGRNIDNIKIISVDALKEYLQGQKLDLLLIAIPSASRNRIREIYEDLNSFFVQVHVLPSLDNILRQESYSSQLKELSVIDLLARDRQDLDKEKISSFVKDQTILITGAGGSIGSEIVRQCIKFQAKKLILLDHSEYNLYRIEQEIEGMIAKECVMQSVVNKAQLEKIFKKYTPTIVIHAAAYKHVPIVEVNIEEGILNNVIGTKNCIDLSIEYGVDKFILISTDKAVRPANVMGATKRICELYAQNVLSRDTHIVAVRFGNVLDSSGSVIPKFMKQIEDGQNITVTHPDITRYFMLIPEACELVLQAGAIGKGGELFILDMGEPIKIVDLAKKMIELSGKDNIEIEFTGLRAGEKLYEELLIDESDACTDYDSITMTSSTKYDIVQLDDDIKHLIEDEKQLEWLQTIVPEFDHKQ